MDSRGDRIAGGMWVAGGMEGGGSLIRRLRRAQLCARSVSAAVKAASSREIEARPNTVPPAGAPARAGAARQTAEARVSDQQHGAAIARDAQPAQQPDELPDLAAIVLVAAKRVCGGLDDDQD